MDPILASFLVALLWAGSSIIHRIMTQKVSNEFIMLISAIVYIITVLTYILIRKPQVFNEIVINHKYILILGLTTFFGLFVVNFLYLHAVKTTNNVNLVSIIMAIYPVITLILSYIFLKEYLSFNGLIGFFIIIFGIIILLSSKK